MYKKTSGTRRWKAGAALFSALMLVLSLTLLTVSLLTGCTKDPKPDDTQTQSAPATSELTTAPPESTLPTETAGTEDSTDVPASETEPTAEPLPADWVPTLNKTDISFFGPGESYILVVPGAAGHFDVVWSAENEEIAAVDETGRVTAVGPGSARIYAKLADTTLECWIRCKFDTPPAEGEPTLNSTDISFFGVGESYRLKVSNAPEDAMIVWTSEDYGVAYVDDNGRVRAVGPGTIRVSARVGDKVLSCWVRCKFAAPEIPRSSVADGSWLVTLRKSGVTALNEEAGVYVATADLLSRIQITLDELESLEPYSKLDLSRFGLGSFGCPLWTLTPKKISAPLPPETRLCASPGTTTSCGPCWTRTAKGVSTAPAPAALSSPTIPASTSRPARMKAPWSPAPTCWISSTSSPGMRTSFPGSASQSPTVL